MNSNNIKNTPTIKGGIIDLNRIQIEHRATWMALMYKEMEKEGYNIEAATRRAIKKTGNIHGAMFQLNDTFTSFEDFKKKFFNGIAIKTFEMENIIASEKELTVEFNYCPLLSAWQKLELSNNDCAKLCDIAMDGDRGIAEKMGYELELTDTIASGCNKCKIRFHKR